MFAFAAERVNRNLPEFKDSRGATLVEFAIISAFLFFFLVIAAEFLFMCYTAVTMQFIATQAMRQSVVGPPPGPTPAATYAQVVENRIILSGQALYVSLEPQNIYICPLNATNIDLKCAVDDTGKSGGLVTIYIQKRFAIPFFNFIGYTLDALAVGRNEPF